MISWHKQWIPARCKYVLLTLSKNTCYDLYLLKLTKNISCFFTYRLFSQITVKHVMVSDLVGEWNYLRKVEVRESCRVIRQNRLSSGVIRRRVNYFNQKAHRSKEFTWLFLCEWKIKYLQISLLSRSHWLKYCIYLCVLFWNRM